MRARAAADGEFLGTVPPATPTEVSDLVFSVVMAALIPIAPCYGLSAPLTRSESVSGPPPSISAANATESGVPAGRESRMPAATLTPTSSGARSR